MLEQYNVINNFLQDKDSRYLLMLCSAFPEEAALEHIKNYAIANNPNVKFKIFPDGKGSKANSDFLKIEII